MDPVATPSTLRALIDMHRWPPTGERTFRALCNRHGHPEKRERSFLFLNTYLLNVWIGSKGGRGFIGVLTGGLSELGELEKAKKPAVGDRARAIGRLVRDSYDIALLTEVFEDNVKDKILEAWPDGDRRYVVEDARRSTRKASGLVTISQQDLLRGKELHEYKFESGSDKRAEKGVMLTRMDIGLESSQLELYNTHLNAGKDSARRFQVLELISFIERTHDENNVAILAGDFNIGAFGDKVYTGNPYILLRGGGGSGPDFDSINPRFSRFILDRLESGDYPDGMSEYEVLIELLNLIGFDDIWVQRNGTPGYTKKLDEPEIAAQICRPDPENPEYCNDLNVPDDPDSFRPEENTSDRIDFIFMSRPQDSQQYSLDFTRPRRVRHERRAGAPKRDEIAFLSDHLGLAINLLISPR